MTDKQFQSLLNRTAKAASATGALMRATGEAFRERYGVTYSDVDADQLVDALDYGNGQVPTIEECDRIMADYGHPALNDLPTA